MTILTLLIVTAFVVTIAAAIDRAPLWIAVFLLVLIQLMAVLPR